jgi:hypothetical protein
MDQAIVHRRPEVARDRAVFRAIAGGEDSPLIAELPVRDSSFEDQPIGRNPRLFICAGKLVEKENAGFVLALQIIGQVKYGLPVLIIESRQAADVRSCLLR